MALFGSWGKGLKKTQEQLFSKINRIFHREVKITDELLDELEAVLIQSDVGVDISMLLIDEMRSLHFEENELVNQVRQTLKERIETMLIHAEQVHEAVYAKPKVILVVGVNGTGKTTTIGKLAWKMKQKGQKVIIAGADTFRAAAGEQLDIWARRANVDCIRQVSGADSAAVAFDALDAAMSRSIDVLLIDTAGRLHTKVNLMEELKKIRRVLDKRMPGAPHQTILVLDATTGQNGLRQAEQFVKDVGVTDIALTKLDGTARGGIVLAIKHQLGIPVRWVGVGEGIEDLLPFDASAFVKGMFGEVSD